MSVTLAPGRTPAHMVATVHGWRVEVTQRPDGRWDAYRLTRCHAPLVTAGSPEDCAAIMDTWTRPEAHRRLAGPIYSGGDAG